MAKVKGCGFSGRAVRNAFTAPADAVALMAPRRSDVSGVCILFPGEAIPVRPHAEGCRSTVGSSSGVKCTPPKLFACRKNFSLRPFPPPFAVAPLPFAARELTREMDNHHHRRKPGCTRNVNVKTAAQESSRKMGEEQNPVSVAREWVAQATSLKAGSPSSDVSRYGDVQVEIRTNGTLNWRAWSFEPDFLFELKRNLQYVQL
jgi:hypothetical protein